MREWQPIETAPKDGNPILACHEYGVFIASGEGKFTNNHEVPATHWMPLPDPPKDADKEFIIRDVNRVLRDRYGNDAKLRSMQYAVGPFKFTIEAV